MLHLLSPRGFRAGSAHAGIKSSQAPDVALLMCERAAAAAAVFTTNKVFAAPVKVGRQHVRGGRLRGVVVNSGNANACTGRQGERDALEMCRVAARAAGCRTEEMLPSSTGIIGKLLPMDKIRRGIEAAAQDLGNSGDHAAEFERAILTTDTRPKSAAVSVKIGRESVVVAGVCKGSGMIGPRLGTGGAAHATMLAYLTTDAKISAAALRKILEWAADESFNAVTVDDHTSTNDTAAMLASGLGAAVDSPRALKAFGEAVRDVCQTLAYKIAEDGEGATKVVRIEVRGARSESDARLMARAIANSPLVKCAMNGNDPNWGRIVSAAGMCGASFDPDKAELRLQKTVVFRKGRPSRFDGPSLSQALAKKEVLVELICGQGRAIATVWTCDLSKEYVAINADYHT